MGNLSAVFKHQTQHNQAILELLKDTTIGTNGAKYKHLHTAEKIAELHKPHYFTIYRNEKAITNITICERPMFLNGNLTDTFYLRYFAFDSAFQTRAKASTKKKTSPFQKYVSDLLRTSNLNIENPEYHSKIYWAIIDPENNRSLQMGERYGFESVANIKTTAFSRVRLKSQANVSRLLESEQSNIWEMLEQFYSDYNGLTNVQLFKNNNYFVLKENNNIVAGIQANIVEWEIICMPGKFGKLQTKLMPYIPFLNKIIKPQKHQFLATEGLFWKTGYESKVTELLTGVLQQQNCHSMLLWSDSRDDRINSTLKNTKLGILEKLKTDNEINLVAKFNHVDAKTRTAMKKNLHYISGFDCT